MTAQHDFSHKRARRLSPAQRESEIARLKENAPTLSGSPRTTRFAIFASVLALLTVVAFYYTIQIYDRMDQQRDEARSIEVDYIPPPPVSEIEKVFAKIEAEEQAAEAEYQAILEDLKQSEVLTPPAETRPTDRKPPPLTPLFDQTE